MRGKIPVREIVQGVTRDLRRSLLDLVLFDLLFRTATTLIVAPVLTWTLRWLVLTGEDQAFGNFDILAAALTPKGFLAVSMVFLVTVTAAFAENAGMLWIGLGAAGGVRVSWLDALKRVGLQLARILRVCFLGLLAGVVAAIPSVIGLAVVYRTFLSRYDINYYLATRPPEWTTALWLGGLVLVPAVAAVAVVYWATHYTIAGILTGGGSARSAFFQSLTLLRRNGLLMVAPRIAWSGAWLLASILVGWLGARLGELLVAGAGSKVPVLLAVLGFLLAFQLFAFTAFVFVLIAVNALLTARLYREACRRSSISVPWPGEAAIADERPAGRLPGKRWILAGSAVAVVVGVVTVYGIAGTEDLGERVRIVAHRGSSLKAPENTLAAIRQAVDDGADLAEIDVQLTADGEVVVGHDADLMRLAGDPRVITETRLDELRDVDVGSWFAPEFAGERMPTLEEAIEEVQGRAGLLVEIKSYRADGAELVARVVEILRDRGMVNDAAIMSLEYGEVREARRIAPEIPSGYTVSAAVGRLARVDAGFLAIAHSRVTGPLIARAHAQDKQIWVWTVNRPEQMSRMIELGVDGIITDEPAALHDVLAARAGLNPAERLLLRFRHLYID